MSLSEELAGLGRHYTNLVREHGDAPAGAQQASRQTQERRMEILTAIADIRDARVFDFGCGAGYFLTYLQSRHGFRGEYIGCDLTDEILEVAQRYHPEARFVRRDVLRDGIGEPVDYAFANGTFNNRLSDNWSFLTAALTALYRDVRRGIAFNLLSTHVEYFTDGLYYADPRAVFSFCKEHLSPLVTLRHDYRIKPGVIPYEFTIYVFRDA